MNNADLKSNYLWSIIKSTFRRLQSIRAWNRKKGTIRFNTILDSLRESGCQLSTLLAVCLN